MKKIHKLISIILITVLLMQLALPVSLAANIPTSKATVLWQKIDDSIGKAQQVAKVDNSIFYSYVDKNIAYSSEITPTGEIYFSYVLSGSNIIKSSGLINLNEIYAEYKISTPGDNYELLNQTIIANITNFEVLSQTVINTSPSTKGFSNLDDAIADAFGSDYSDKFIGGGEKSHNGTYYPIRCTETQTTSYDTPDSTWFEKDTAVTEIIAWLLSGDWGWIGLELSLITSAITTVITEGVHKLASDIRAERSNVSIVRTRIVAVSGYSGSQYWAGWTREWYFLKGDLGWTHDTGAHVNRKHADYDDVSTLLAKGFDNFVNSELQ